MEKREAEASDNVQLSQELVNSILEELKAARERLEALEKKLKASN